MAISKIKKNSLEANIIDEELVTADVITQQTELSDVATNDTILVYDTSAGVLKKISQTNFLNFPTVSSVSPTNLTSGDGTGNYTIVITGSGFTGATAKLLKSDNATEISFSSQTVDSDTQITGTIAKSSLSNADESFGVRVAASTGLVSSLNQQITIDAQPVFSTAAGSLGTVANGARGSTTFTVVAADPESGGDVVYTLESGSLPAGCSLTSTSSGAVLSGFDAVGSNTTSTFTIRAKDVNSNTSDREFTITVNAPQYQSFTSSGTFSVPSGVAAVDVLVVAGGASGGVHHGGGGGAGGLIYRPGFPVTPGGTVTVTVGDGGASVGDFPGPSAQGSAGNNGQDSVFGTLTAKGGGAGSSTPSVSPSIGVPGGSAGGGSGAGPTTTTPGGTATQPTQPGDSGTYGFGGNGGQGTNNAANYTPGGGGGSGGNGGNGVAGGSASGQGGVGRAFTISDGTTSVYYAGGGGGSGHPGSVTAGQGGQGGGGQGGSCNQNNFPARSATANRGGGGGGADRGSSCVGRSGAGGKGIVIVAY